MKKLISFIGLAAVVLFGFTSCDKEKPKFNTDLNTGHQYVGRLYGANGLVDSANDAQGIIFAVSPDGGTAYLVAFTDLMEVAPLDYLDKDNKRFIGYSFFASPKEWSKSLFYANAKHKDGKENTNRIIQADIDADSVNHKGSGTAAQECREYFKRAYKDTVEQSVYDNDTNWITTKGQWYLPSMEELAALMKVKDKINQMYLQGEPASDGANKIYFQAIGGELNFAYWSSTEYDERYAWYDLPASNNDSYIPKTWSDEHGNGRIYVRPIRTVEL